MRYICTQNYVIMVGNWYIKSFLKISPRQSYFLVWFEKQFYEFQFIALI